MQEDMRPGMPHPEHDMMPRRSRTAVLPWVILLVVILALLIGAVLFRDKIMHSNKSNNAATNATGPSGYQAVFLTNGQVYFGKLSDANSQYLTLTDIYYLQLIQQPGLQGNGQNQNQQSNQQGQLTLMKLGKSELHLPVDSMKINRDQVLFFEDIQEEGSVMKAIRSYQANPNQGQQNTNSNANTNTNTQAPANNAATNSNK